MRHSIPTHLELNLKRKDKLVFLRGDDRTSRLRDKTSDVFKVLFPDVPNDYVAFRSFLIVGTMESGKTSLLRFLAKRAIEKYGRDNINVVGSNKLSTLIEKMDNRKVQLLLMDDAYRHGKKLTSEEIASLFEIRHIYEDKGNTNGLIIVGAVIQDFFSVDKKLRSNINVFFIKSFPSTGYDKSVYKKEFGSEGYRFLKRLTRQIFLRIDNTAKAYALVKFNFSDIPGIFTSEFVPIDEDPIEWVISKEATEQTESSTKVVGDLKFELESKIEDPGFLKLLVDVYPETLERLKKMYSSNPFKKFKEKMLNAWALYYIEGTSADRVAEIYNVSKAALLNKYEQSGWLSIVDRELLGHLAENALVKKYFQGYEIIAGESEPDLINKAEKIAVEVKVRRRYEGPSASMINQKELQLLDQGWQLKLAIITYKQKDCKILIFRVSKQNENAACNTAA